MHHDLFSFQYLYGEKLYIMHKVNISNVIIIEHKSEELSSQCLNYPNSPCLLVAGMILAVGVLVGIFVSVLSFVYAGVCQY